MAKFKPYNINQTMLLPLSIHDFVKDGSLAKLVNKVVIFPQKSGHNGERLVG